MRLLLLILFLQLPLTNLLAQDSLKVISWNVFLRPGILKDRQNERVDSIAEQILGMNADVVVLQEVFHKKSRRRLIKSLSETYPFHTAMGRKTFWGVPSGNCLFSKDSIRSQQFIYFKRATSSDKLAKKGAIMIEIEHGNHSFSISGTHLQAGGGAEGAQIRKSQVDQIAALAAQQPTSTTSLFAGDFNIQYADTLFDYVLENLEAITAQPSNQPVGTANFSDHTLTNASGSPKWIDFILLKSEGLVQFVSSRIEEPRCMYQGRFERISDHNPIITVFGW